MFSLAPVAFGDPSASRPALGWSMSKMLRVHGAKPDERPLRRAVQPLASALVRRARDESSRESPKLDQELFFADPLLPGIDAEIIIAA
jgi:hypothetical protein